MNDLVDQFLTPSGMLIFFLGIASACGWQWVKGRFMDGRREKINWQVIGILMGITAMVYIGMQNTQLSANVRMCQREFQAAVKQVADWGTENDRLSIEQRELFLERDEAEAMWIRRLVQPDNPTIAGLDVDDKRRQAWAWDVTLAYQDRANKLNEKIRAINDRQHKLDEKRRSNPLPPPTCGK